MMDVSRLASIAEFHAIRATYGGTGAEFHMRAETTARDAHAEILALREAVRVLREALGPIATWDWYSNARDIKRTDYELTIICARAALAKTSMEG